MGGPMTKRLLQDQQQIAEHQQLVSYAQPQHWPNQEPPAQPEPEDDDDEDDDLDPDEPLDEPGEEVEASRSEPSDALKAERRKTNQLERELRTIKRQLAQFSKINPDEYERLQEAERQKEQLEREIASRELQLEAAAARKVFGDD